MCTGYSLCTRPNSLLSLSIGRIAITLDARAGTWQQARGGKEEGEERWEGRREESRACAQTT